MDKVFDEELREIKEFTQKEINEILSPVNSDDLLPKTGNMEDFVKYIYGTGFKNIKPYKELTDEIQRVFKVSKSDISIFKPFDASNYVYSFIVKGKKYVIKKLNKKSIMDWRQEKAAYEALKPLNITDEIISFENGIKISKFLKKSNALSFSKADQIESLDLLRQVHESGVSINYDYDIIGNIKKYLLQCNPDSDKLKELNQCIDGLEMFEDIIKKLNIPKVLCHGDACLSANFLRLPDNSVKIIDWEQAGMADPILDIAIASLNQGIENIDPVWSLHQYLKKTPEPAEYFRLYLYLTLHSLTMMAWCVSCDDTDGFDAFKKYMKKYNKLALEYIVIGLSGDNTEGINLSTDYADYYNSIIA